MKHLRYFVLAALAMSMSSCLYTLSTFTSTPAYVATTPTIVNQVAAPTYSTTRISAPAKQTTTIVYQTNSSYYNDPCLYLDLRAVAAAFAESRTIQDFENILNSSRYMVSNLDMNHDGFVDYLRVMEALDGYTHVLVLQAVLAHNVFQDVATIVVECQPLGGMPYVQVIGEPFLYGEHYIIEPVFHKLPALLSHNHSKYGYTVWHSPYYWDNFPTYYAKPKPRYLSHYQAYVDTYCHNHAYCRESHYVEVIHYTQYVTIREPLCRHDYATSHPKESFEQRISTIQQSTSTGSNSTTTRSIRNANDVRTVAQVNNNSVNTASAVRAETTSTRNAASETKTPTSSSTSTRTQATTTTSSSSTSTRTQSTTTPSSSSSSRTTVVSPSTSSSSSTRTASSTTSRTPSVTVTSRMSPSGETTRTTTTTTSSDGSRTSSTTRNTATSTRTSTTTTRTTAPSTTSTRSSSASSSSSTRSSSAASSTRTSSSTAGSGSSSSTRTSSSTSTRR